jgi:CheY-like chemotaxis protein
MDPARLARFFTALETYEGLGVWEWHASTNVLVWSNGFYNLLDLPRSEPPSFELLLTRVRDTDRIRVEALLAQARTDRADREILHHVVCATGERRIQMKVFQTSDGLIAIARDTTVVRKHTASALPRGRVLIVDDEVLFAAALRRLLGSEHDVTVVHDGRVALELFRAGERYDVILSDVMMPNVTGSQLHATLVELAPDQAERMIFVTGGTLGHDPFFEQITNLVFEKPCDVQILRSTVRHRVNELVARREAPKP